MQDAIRNGILGRVKDTLKVDIEDYDGDEEWFYVESDDFEDSDLFNQLRLHWNRIVGIHAKCCALLHCQGGPDSGVWIHCFDGDDYAPGCHRLPSW